MKMSTSKRMLVGIVCLVILETAIFTGYFLVNTNTEAARRTEKSMREVLLSNARLLDTIMTDVVDRAERICVDTNMRELVSVLHSSDIWRKMDWSDSMRKIVFNYFGTMANGSEAYIRDINILSSDFSYTDRNLFFYTYEEFIESKLYHSGLEERSYYFWSGTEDAREHLSDRMRIYIQGTNSQVDTVVFHLVKRMNISTVEGNAIFKMPGEIPSPYIIISLAPALLYDTFSPEGLTQNSRYMVVDREGRIISNEDLRKNGSRIEETALLEVLGSIDEYHSGTYVIDGKETMVGILPAESSDWFYVCMVPQTDVSHTMESMVAIYIRLLAVTFFLTLLLAVLFVKGTMRPVVELAQKADVIASGNQGVLRSDSPRETDRILSVIDGMNEQIEHLTESNVELERRERDANILMLEMQINPHFLYNSLNKLHLGLLKAGEEEIAQQVIALSHALRYSVDTREHLVYLHRDIEQLKLYLTVVQSAHENKFAVYYDIDDVLYNTIVPKMLLQPFVENSILHGFKDASFGCLIHIAGALQPDGDVVYTVTDNGTGIPEEKKEMVLSGGYGHIGCANVHKRIQLLFGEKYGVTVIPVAQGTQISIRLPCLFER